MLEKMITLMKKRLNLNGPDELLCKEYIEYDSLDKTRRKREDLIQTMVRGCSVLEEIGVKYWLGRGSVLGFHRDNDFLPNDIDIDIDVYSDKDIYSIIHKMPFDVLFVTSSRGRYMQLSLLDRPTGTIFDIWFYHDQDGKLMNRNYFGYFWLPAEKCDQLQMMDLYGRQYPVPDPEWYCNFWYGMNWRIPKAYGKDWSIAYRKDCKGFIYTGIKNVEYLHYYNEKDKRMK
jgi:hypothetical protein